jgi:hypothetical protein
VSGEDPGWAPYVRLGFIVVTLLLVAVYVGRHGWLW